ncbi:MAG: hypothetical protein KAS32_16270 [Candidatus Peribacteraceae bacterium]|nr:hypothetical protein [Candidatus Peribacteraceae bacterium]
MEKIILTWDDIIKDCRTLASQLECKKMLLPITRGGLHIAGFLSQMLNIRDIRTIGISCYTDDDKQGSIKLGHMTQIDDANLHPHECLVVDDILDSGNTLTIVDALWMYNDVPTAVLYDKGISDFKPNHVGRVIENKWVVFPWEI